MTQKSCVYCHKPLGGRQKKYCNSTCKTAYLADGPLPEGSSFPDEQLPTSHDIAPPGQPMTAAPMTPPPVSEPPPAPQAIQYPHPTWKTYQDYIEKYWKAGDYRMEVLRFVGVHTPGTFNLESQQWQTVIDTIMTPNEVTIFAQTLTANFNGGFFQLRVHNNNTQKCIKRMLFQAQDSMGNFPMVMQQGGGTGINNSALTGMLAGQNQRVDAANQRVMSQQQATHDQALKHKDEVHKLEKELLQSNQGLQQEVQTKIQELRNELISGEGNQAIIAQQLNILNQQLTNAQTQAQAIQKQARESTNDAWGKLIDMQAQFREQDKEFRETLVQMQKQTAEQFQGLVDQFTSAQTQQPVYNPAQSMKEMNGMMMGWMSMLQPMFMQNQNNNNNNGNNDVINILRDELGALRTELKDTRGRLFDVLEKEREPIALPAAGAAAEPIDEFEAFERMSERVAKFQERFGGGKKEKPGMLEQAADFLTQTGVPELVSGWATRIAGGGGANQQQQGQQGGRPNHLQPSITIPGGIYNNAQQQTPPQYQQQTHYQQQQTQYQQPPPPPPTGQQQTPYAPQQGQPQPHIQHQEPANYTTAPPPPAPEQPPIVPANGTNGVNGQSPEGLQNAMENLSQEELLDFLKEIPAEALFQMMPEVGALIQRVKDGVANEVAPEVFVQGLTAEWLQEIAEQSTEEVYNGLIAFDDSLDTVKTERWIDNLVKFVHQNKDKLVMQV